MARCFEEHRAYWKARYVSHDFFVQPLNPPFDRKVFPSSISHLPPDAHPSRHPSFTVLFLSQKPTSRCCPQLPSCVFPALSLVTTAAPLVLVLAHLDDFSPTAPVDRKYTKSHEWVMVLTVPCLSLHLFLRSKMELLPSVSPSTLRMRLVTLSMWNFPTYYTHFC